MTVDQSSFFQNNVTRVYKYHIFPQYYTDNGSALYIVATAGSSVVINGSNFHNNGEGRFPNVVLTVYIKDATDVRFESELRTTPPAEATTMLEIQTEITTTLNPPQITHSRSVPIIESTTSHPTTTSKFFTERTATISEQTATISEYTATISEHSEPMERTTRCSSEFVTTTLGPTSEVNTNTEVSAPPVTVSTEAYTSTYSVRSTSLATDKSATDFPTDTEIVTHSTSSSNISQSTADQGKKYAGYYSTYSHWHHNYCCDMCCCSIAHNPHVWWFQNL